MIVTGARQSKSASLKFFYLKRRVGFCSGTVVQENLIPFSLWLKQSLSCSLRGMVAFPLMLRGPSVSGHVLPCMWDHFTVGTSLSALSSALPQVSVKAKRTIFECI